MVRTLIEEAEWAEMRLFGDSALTSAERDTIAAVIQRLAAEIESNHKRWEALRHFLHIGGGNRATWVKMSELDGVDGK